MKIALLVVLTALISGSADVKLEYAFHVGDEYTMLQVTEQTIKQSIMGTLQEGENHYSGEMAFKVIALTAQGAKLETQFLSLKNKSKTILGEITMDSDGDEANVQNKIFKTMMRKTFFVTLNKNGKVEDVEGAENLWAGLSGLDLDESTLTNLKQSLDQMLSKKSLKNNFEQALVQYDDKKIRQGDVWSSNTEFPMDFPIRIENSWNLVGVSNGIAIIQSNGVYATTDKDRVVNLPNGIKAKVDLNGKQTIKSTVNTKTGWPTELHMVSELKGRMLLLAGGMLPQDMEMPTEILTETTYTIVRK